MFFVRRPGLAAFALLAIWCDVHAQSAPEAANVPAPAEPAANDGSVTVLPPIIVQGEKQKKRQADTTTSVKVVKPASATASQSLPSAIGETGIASTETSVRANGEVVDPARPLNEIVVTAPNLTVIRSYEPPIIRGVEGGGPGGIANTAIGGTPSRVPIVIDGVARPASLPYANFNSTWDAKQIEVLNGPQTTIQGGQAIAGAIIVDTNEPVFASAVAAEATSRFNEFGATNTFNGMLNATLIPDLLAARVTIERTDGDVPQNIIDVPAGRESDADALSQFDQTRIKAKALLTPQGRTGPLQISGLIDYQIGTIPQTPNTVQGPDFSDRNIRFLSGGLRLFENEAVAAALDSSYKFGDGSTLRSITSYAESNFYSRNETPLVPTPFNAFFNFSDAVYNQELLYSFGNHSDRLSGLVGVNYNQRQLDIQIDNKSFPAGVRRSVTDGTTDTASVFADLSYRLFGGLSVIGGGRVLHEKQDRFVASNVSPFQPLAPAATLDFSSSETVALPKIGLQQKLDDENTLSFTAREGWNSGSATVSFFSGQPYVYEPETVWTYELGYRYAAASGRLTFGATAFYNEHEDTQFFLQAIPGNLLTTQVVNVPEGRSYGAEFDVRAVLTPGLIATAGLGLLHTEITEAPAGNAALAGNHFGKDPKATISVGAVWTPWFAEGLSLDGKVRYMTEYYSDFNNLERERAGNFAIVDLGLSFNYRGWEGRAFVDNVGDVAGETFIVSGAQFADVISPRTFGLSLKAQY